MSYKPQTSDEYLTAQQRNEEFFEQIDPEFSADIEIISFEGLKRITRYQNSSYQETFLVELRFKSWQQAAKQEPLLRYLRHPWFDSGIYKEDVYRIGKSLFLRKLLF